MTIPSSLAGELEAFAALAVELGERVRAAGLPPLAPAPVERPRRVARGTVPPPLTRPAAPHYRGGFRADMSDERLRGRATLEREWEGRVIRVNVLPEGFEWGGKLWSSLSAIARVVVGHRRNGYEFFGLTEAGRGAGRGSRGRARAGRSRSRR